MEIIINKEQAEDILDLLTQHEELCHKTQHGTLIFEHIELREYVTKKLSEGEKKTTDNATAILPDVMGSALQELEKRLDWADNGVYKCGYTGNILKEYQVKFETIQECIDIVKKHYL